MSDEVLSSLTLYDVRKALLEGLSRQDRTFFTYGQLLHHLAKELFKEEDDEYRAKIISKWESHDVVTRAVEEPDTRKIMTVLWTLVSEGLLYPRFNTSNSVNTPVTSYFGITEYGQKCLANLETHPYSPRFVDYLRQKAPGISDEILANLEDASECLRRGLLRAAVVMIGLASEATIRVTAEALFSLGECAEPKKKAVQQIAQVRDAVDKWTTTQKQKDEKHRVTQALSALETIRVERNQTAHPGFVQLDRSHIEDILILAQSQILVFWQIPIARAIAAGFVLTQ